MTQGHCLSTESSMSLRFRQGLELENVVPVSPSDVGAFRRRPDVCA